MDQTRLIDTRFSIAFIAKASLANLSEQNLFDENVLKKLTRLTLRLESKKCINNVSLHPK